MILARSLAFAGFTAAMAAALLAPADASAQQIYRIVGPDGRVTFSDQAPREAAKATAAPVVPIPGDAGTLASLPFELRQAAARYPVTLYSAPGCNTCAAGRTLLVQRGIPFNERSVTTSDDVEAFKRISGGNSLPLLTIGGQQIKGYSDTEWMQFLDAAGYPKTSQLPPTYTPSPATPLVALDPARPPGTAVAGQPGAQQGNTGTPATATTEPPPSVDNPAGIKF